MSPPPSWRKTWTLLGFQFAASVLAFMVAPFLAIYLGRTLGFNATQTGLVLGAGAITGLPAALFAGSLTARFGARRVLSWSMALAGIALAGFALVESLALLATAAATMRLGPQSMSLREPC